MILCFALFLALAWGIIWAGFLQFSEFGRFLVTKRTWITVIVGMGVDLLIMLVVVSWRAWWQVALIVAISAVPIVLRSLLNEKEEAREIEKVCE